ncbi:hypothetical protein AB1Y20_018084 [Prymnesium parvum]|uniref:WRKY19-like zinc finger domain-containing protein n=1 Tax=Prymnesium parvum TaxID=97485 RepID=A0AB34JN23_PRYPA
MALRLLEEHRIDAWHELISSHNSLQLRMEELRLPTRTHNMPTTLPSLSSPMPEAFEQPTDVHAAVSHAAVAVAMAQSQGQAGRPSSSGAQPLMMINPGVMMPMAGQPAGLPQMQNMGYGARDSISHNNQRSNTKNCVYPGCTKGAIGKLKLCIAHGGGKRCTVPGCNKAAQGQQPLCKAHGGGRRCQFPGCPRSARDRTDLCIGHGGGKRCAFVGCSTSARSGTLYCSLHDGVIKKHSVRMGGGNEGARAQECAEPQLARNGNGVYGYMSGAVPVTQQRLPPQ